jgi:1,5-anhydro-D-fructose reductase (1,5-anhydro-D-mannitol-forming)
VLRVEFGEERPDLAFENYYVAGVLAFHAAIAGKGEPVATGEDGLRSLAAALAARQAATTGRLTTIETGL